MKRLLMLLIGILFISYYCHSQQTAAFKIIVTAPEIDDQTQHIFLAGSFNGWKANDSLYMLQKGNDEKYFITIPAFNHQQYKYKFTLGNWDKVEVDEKNQDVSDRILYSEDGMIYYDTVKSWKANQPKPTPSVFDQKIQSKIDSVLNTLKPELNNMQLLLKDYVTNFLSDKPSQTEQKRLDDIGAAKMDKAYRQITQLLWDIFAEFTPEQKQKMKSLLDNADKKDTFINNFSKSFNTVKQEK